MSAYNNKNGRTTAVADTLKPIEILQVEDDRGDARLVEITLRKAKVTNRVQTVEDGVEALHYLRMEGQYANSPRPDLILLDLRLPRMDGHEFLAEVKADDDLGQIPVVVLTSSKSDKDLLSSYDLKAEGYATKPLDKKQFMWAIDQIDNLWINIVKLPPK